MNIENESKTWNEVSGGYVDFIRPIFERAVEQHKTHLELKPEMRVLDLACGPGTASLQLFEDVRLIDGLDFSQEMIRLFDREIEERNIQNIKTHIGDGQNLSRFEDNTFDRVISLFGLIFFQDRVKALKEIHRALKPEGKVLITSWPPMNESSFMTTFLNAVQETGCMPQDEPSESSTSNSDLGIPDPEIFCGEFEQAEFTLIKKEKISLEVQVNDIDTLWDQNERGSVPLLMIKKGMNKEKWLELKEKAVANLKKELRPPCQLEFRAWVWLLSRS